MIIVRFTFQRSTNTPARGPDWYWKSITRVSPTIHPEPRLSLPTTGVLDTPRIAHHVPPRMWRERMTGLGRFPAAVRRFGLRRCIPILEGLGIEAVESP